MSLADLSSTLSGLSMNPTFNMGVGLMAASGPSLMPHSLGQGLAAGAQFSQDATMKAAQAAMMRAQFQRYAWQNALLQRAIAGSGSDQSNPNYSPSLAGTATQRATDAASSDPGTQSQVYGSQGFTNGISATPTQIASQQFPQVSQGGAQALGMGSTAGAPSTPQGGGVLQQIMRTPTGMAAFAMNPSSTLDFAMARQFPMPTSDIINLQQAGALPAGSPERQALLGKYAVKTRNGAFIPGMGNYYSPNMPDGTVLRDPFNPSAGVILPQGMTQAQAAMSAAKAYPEEAAKARYAYPIALGQDTAHAQTTPATVIGSDGKPQFVSQAAAIGAGASGRPMQAAYTPAQEEELSGWGKTNATYVEGVQTAASAVPQMTARLSEMRADLAKFEPGAFSEWRNQGAAYLNDMANFAGMPATYKGDQLAGYQDFAKNATQIALGQAKQMGSRIAAQEVQYISNSNPNAKMTRGALDRIMNLMEGVNQSASIENDALTKWHQGGGGTDQFRAMWSKADVPGLLTLQHMSPHDAKDFMDAQTPQMRQQIYEAAQIAKQQGWVQ